MRKNRTLTKKLPALALLALAIFAFFNIGNVMLAIAFFMFITLPGLGFLWLYNQGGASTAPFAIPASMTIGTGVLLMFQSITSYWESWAFAWILYGVFLGIGLVMMGSRLNDSDLVKVGKMMTRVSGLAFIALGGLFILLTSALLQYAIVLALIAGGVYLLINDGIPVLVFEKRKNSDAVDENIDSLTINPVKLEQDIA